MSGTSRPTRRCKREMAVASVDDEPTSSKRAVKSAKGEETEGGPSYAELHEFNLKLAENLQRVCRVAREKELRAERAEKQLESKQAMIDGSKRVMELEKTVASLKKQLVEERKLRSEEKERDEKKIDELTFQLSKYVLRVEEPPHLHPVEDKEPEPQPLSLQQLLDSAAPPLDVQQPQPLVDMAPDQQPLSLPQLLDSAAPPLVVQQPQLPLTLQQLLQQNLNEAARDPAGEKLHESGHHNNILQMCRPDMPYSMTMADAAVKLSGPLGRCGLGNFFKNCYVATNMKFPCEACGLTLNKYSFLGHFFTDAHVEKVHSHGGAVSVAAVNYWVRVLSAVAAQKRQKRAAGAAARTAAATAAAAAGKARSLADVAASLAAAAASDAAGPSRAAVRQAAEAATAPKKVKKEGEEE